MGVWGLILKKTNVGTNLQAMECEKSKGLQIYYSLTIGKEKFVVVEHHYYCYLKHGSALIYWRFQLGRMTLP